jgi:hypothetical protein
MSKKFNFKVRMTYYEYYEVTATSLMEARTIMRKSTNGEDDHPLYKSGINESLHDNWGDARPTSVEFLGEEVA